MIAFNMLRLLSSSRTTPEYTVKKLPLHEIAFSPHPPSAGISTIFNELVAEVSQGLSLHLSG